MCRLHYFAGDETRDEAISLAIGRVVIHEYVVGVLASVRKALY
jgi:hypothetical protein